MSGIIKESETLLTNIRSWSNAEGKNLSEKDDASYGHALRVMGAQAEDHQDNSPEEQKAFLRERALELIEKYGKNIKRVMKPELLEALDIKDN